ncbi:NADH-quinone oxidoreductase subunit NuoB [Sporomusa malonica]|uniref:Ni,Fe-hydrogenase III small subunit n=1 Tax=Sporomusa malonica TaxID=112901 RepID=A0A1W2CB11_9FIRM|nr:NADH-quinone oxidoreductase subunit NuoB [Sporomusa malonica]SMC82467.1 Ni,Fe-hydrogenase III small subunit [Sporomusa malonica]
MLNLLMKIVRTGRVTEHHDSGTTIPPRFRGKVAWKDSQCRSCEICREACPTGAIAFSNGQLVVDNNACIFCGRCSEVCEHNALGHTAEYQLAVLRDHLSEKIKATLKRSLHIRHVDAGSCNACDWEMTALNNPVYDLQQYGIDFVASPRHADMIMVTGVVTRNLTQALTMTYEAVPAPKLVMAVGACAASGKVFGNSYAIRGAADTIVPVDIYVPGCPPRPAALIYGLLLALDRLGGNHK